MAMTGVKKSHEAVAKVTGLKRTEESRRRMSLAMIGNTNGRGNKK